MERYALIHSVLPREFVLLQGTGCRWKRCTFCDYHGDVSDNPFAVNNEVLTRVQGVYGVLDVIFPNLRESKKIEILINNTDLGVG